MRSSFPATLLLVAIVLPAGAPESSAQTPTAVPQLLIDEEPSNNTIAMASIQMTAEGNVTSASGIFTFDEGFGDIDYLGLGGLVAGNVVEVSTTPLGDRPFFEIPDTIVGVLTDFGVAECVGDDTFNNDLDQFPMGFGSLCRYEIPVDGDYYVGVTGFSTVPFDGEHYEVGMYSVTVTITSLPEPGGLLQLASGVLGLVALYARRRTNS